MSSQTARLQISATVSIVPDAPISGSIGPSISIDRQLTPGSGSGKADQCYRVDATMASGETDTYNLLAAGALKTPLNETVDLDEVKGIVVTCNTGSVKVCGSASNSLTCFSGDGGGIVLTAGQSLALDLGAGGTAVGSAGSFDVREAAAAAATYSLLVIGAT
jgi:hypothetical protein